MSLKAKISFFIFIVIHMASFSSGEERYHTKEGYLLGAGDVIEISIFAGGESQYKGETTVSSAGFISCPFLGEINAKGLAVEQLAKNITGSLAESYFVNPQIIISVKEYHSRKIYILGEIKSPGLYELKSNTTLLELISQAGGAKEERGKFALILRESVEDIKKGGKLDEILKKKDPLRIDLTKLLDQGDLSRNLRLKNDDVIYLPSKTSSHMSEWNIYVMGRVKNPGTYDFQEGLTALNACIIAGGFDEFAAPNRARITRTGNGKTEIIKINLNKVKMGKIEDVPLKPGDRVYIPESRL